MQLVTIGKAALQAGVGVETLRFYEKENLIDAPLRADSGYRLYPPEAIAQVCFIRRAKQLGFSLKEIRELLSLSKSSDATRCDVRSLAEAKVGDIRRKIRSLRKMEKALSELVATCQQDGSAKDCPILKTLED